MSPPSLFVRFDEMRLYHFEAFMYTLVIQHRIHRIHPRQKSFIFGKKLVENQQKEYDEYVVSN